MARRSREQKGLVPLKDIGAAIRSGNDGGDELVAASTAADEIGRKPKAGNHANNVDKSYRAFVKILADLGVGIDDLREAAPVDRHGCPIFPAAVFNNWAVVKLATSTASANSIGKEVCNIRKHLEMDRWATGHLKGSGPAAKKLSNLIRSGRINSVKPNKKKARPIFPADLERFADRITANEWDWAPLCVAAHKSWTIVSWYMVGRPCEYSYRLRWKHVDLDERTVTVPPYTFKTNRGTLQSEIPCRIECTSETCHQNCAVATLRAYRQTLIAHGVPVDDDALVWPSVRNIPPGRKSRGWQHVAKKFGAELFVADPMATRIAAAKANGEDTGVGQGKAENNHAREYRRRWNNVAEAAGFTARHDWEEPRPHGLRRGAIQTIIANGGSIELASQRAGHASPKHTGHYTTTEPQDTSPLMAGELTAAEPATVASRSDLPADCKAKQREIGCEVPHEGVPCDNPVRQNSYTAVAIGDETYSACAAHWERYRKGRTGDDLTEPIRAFDPDATCEVVHHGDVCGRGLNDGGGNLIRFVLDGETVSACKAHYNRFWNGKTGDDLTQPISKRK